MNIPQMVSKAKSRDNQTTFLGYNHNLINGANEFYDMKNMTGDFCPIMSPRPSRAKLDITFRNPQGLLAKGALAWVDDNEFWYGGHRVGVLPPLDEEKYKNGRQLVSMGAYIVIWPDKYRYNTSNDDFVSLEAEWKATGAVEISLCKMDGEDITAEERELTQKPDEPRNGDWWIDTSGSSDVLKCYSDATEEWVSVATTYVKIQSTDIGKNFEKLDAVKINDALKEKGIEAGTYPIWSKGDDYIVICRISEHQKST